MRTVGDKVHNHNSNYIYSVAKSNRDSIEFSLSIAEQRAVGFIPAWSLASLHIGTGMRSRTSMLYIVGIIFRPSRGSVRIHIYSETIEN